LPPADRSGWPWTEESLRTPEREPEVSSLPKITIVTPSFKHGQFIEETIRSILLQGYPDIEYFIFDAGSTDETVDIIRKYSPWISFWVSEPDRGQSAAINRGLRMGSGSWATWINSDDMLCKDALTDHFGNKVYAEYVVYIGDCVMIDKAGNNLFTHRGRVQSLEDLVRIPSVWRAGGSIDQPAVLFPLELALRVGALNEENHYTMDYDLWGKFFLAGAQFRYTGIPFGIFRQHEEQKTRNILRQTEWLLNSARLLVTSANTFSAETKEEILSDLKAYQDAYPHELWKQTGRLAKAGIPPAIVTFIRSIKAKAQRSLTPVKSRR
jgi:glycosyltransferase involved in cell wall biosynthesis